MGKPTYLVVLKEPNRELWKQIEHKWSGGRHHFINETMAFIDPVEPTNSGDLSKMLGFTDEIQHIGFVVSLDPPIVTAGRFYNNFWEWIKNHG